MSITNTEEIEAQKREIISYIKHYIRANKLEENSKLPSENSLSEKFHTNRNTVRGALATLKAQGLIYSAKGKGFFVSEKPKPVVYQHDNSLGFSEILNQGTRNFKSEILSVEKRKATPHEQKILKLDNEEDIYYLKQVRSINERKLALCTSVIPAKITPGLELHTDDFKGTNNIFLNTYHFSHPICKKVKLIACLPKPEEMEVLEIPENMPILQQESLFETPEQGLIEYFVVRARGDMFHFSMEFA